MSDRYPARRQVLAALGSASGAFLAGCSGLLAVDGDGSVEVVVTTDMKSGWVIALGHSDGDRLYAGEGSVRERAREGDVHTAARDGSHG